MAAVERISIERRVRGVGQLMPFEEVTISNEVAGRVERLTVDFGSSVTRGQLLAMIEATEYELAVARAESAVVQSLAALGLPSEGDENAVQVDETPGVALNRAALEDARTKLESASRLVKNRDIPEQRYLEAVKTVEQREASLREAQDRVRVQIATVKVNRAQLAIESERLAKTRITAPFNGVIQSREVSPGQYVKENANLFKLVRLDPLRLRVPVPEAAAARVRVGQVARFQTDALPGRSFETVFSEIGPALDPANRTLLVEARVPNAEGTLKPGMFASVEILLDEDAWALAVPETALIPFAGLTKLLLVDSKNQLSEVVVETGESDAGMVEIIGDALQEGDRVVIGNPPGLGPGMTVRIGAGS